MRGERLFTLLENEKVGIPSNWWHKLQYCFLLWTRGSCELRVFAKGLNFDMAVAGSGDSDTFGDIILFQLLGLHSFDQI